MKTTLLSLILVTLTFSMISCTRLGVNDSSQVKLILPDSLSVSQSANNSILSAATVNCFLVMASGPEATMQKNTCDLIDVDGTNPSQLKAGPWVGAVPAGSELSIDVPSGKDRTLFIAGFEAQAGECRDFRTGPSPQDLDIFLLGKSLPVILEPGKTVEVPITLNTSSTTLIDTCRGPDFPVNGGGAPTKITLRKQDFPANTFSTNQCAGVEAVLLDAFDRNANAPANINFLLEKETATAGTFASEPIFINSNDCIANTNAISSGNHVILSGKQRAFFFVRASTVSGAPQTRDFRVSASGLSSSTRQITTYGPNYIGLNLILPERILPGICYKAELLLRDLAPPQNLYPAPAGGGSVGFSLSGATAYVSSTDCSNGTSAVTALNYPATQSVAFVYIKMDTVPTTTELSLYGNSLSPSFSSVNITPVQSRAFRGGGTAIPTKIELRGDTKIAGTPSTCYNKYYLATLVNNMGTAVPAPNGNFGVFRTDATPSAVSALEPYDTPSCSPSMIAEPTGTFSPFVLGSAQKKIFVKLPTPGFYNLNLTPVLNGVTAPPLPAYSIEKLL